MSILIILRKQSKINVFNELLLNSINLNIANNAILCSGFFQENSFSASLTTGLASALYLNNIEITTIGVYNYLWRPQYVKFRDNLLSSGVRVNAKISKSCKWHAKIFILKKGGNPIFGIIGSSNMTSRAFGICKNFNFEADVVLWDSNYDQLSELTDNKSIYLSNLNELIYVDYNKEKNRISPMDQLRELEKELNIEKLMNL